MASEPTLSVPIPPPWRRAVDSRLVLGICYTLAAILTALAVALGSSPSLSGPLGPASPVVISSIIFGWMSELAWLSRG